MARSVATKQSHEIAWFQTIRLFRYARNHSFLCAFFSFRLRTPDRIRAGAGIQSFQNPTNSPDSGFHREDDFLREPQCKLYQHFTKI
jgi:hypothetical protein